MRKFRGGGIAFIVLVFITGAASTAFPQAHSARRLAAPASSERAAIEALESNYVDAFNRRDVNKIMASYAPGKQLFVFDAVPPREYVGWDAYKRDWESLFAAFPGPVTDKMSELSITVAGPVAYAHHIEDTTFTGKDGSKKELVARVTDVFRKINGRWLIVQEHVSFPVDLATGQADLMSKP